MIKFKFSSLVHENVKLKKATYEYKNKYPEILYFTGDFQITINGFVFFSEPYFPILEFLRDVLEWVSCENKTKPMLYNSIETEENPLISFIERSGKWYVQSPWQKYECDITFTRGELEKAVLDLKHTIIKEHPEFQISSTLKEE